MEIRTYISIITLNVNGLNAPTKRHRLAEWIQKTKLVGVPTMDQWKQMGLAFMRIQVQSMASLSR